MKGLFKYLILFLLSVSTQSFAEDQSLFNKELLKIQQKWANTNYALQGEQQQKQFKYLIKNALRLSEKYPDRAEAWIWLGISQSSYAGAKGGLGALSLVKDAKQALETAIRIDGEALSGSAYTSLGTLYHKVPGWPIAFGNDKQARKLLQTAVKINPDGIDPNYFYGAFLYDQGDYQAAKEALLLAQKAPKRADRPLADKGRQIEIAQLLAKVEQKIK